jgi:ferredoxin--NADP+ reductase
MYKISEKKDLAPGIKLMGILAPHVTHNAKAGNFIVVITDEKGERVPLTIYDWDRDKGIVYMIFQEIGASTIKLGKMNINDSVFAIAGPLGKHFHIEKYGNAVIIGGGVGVPAIFPIARALRDAGNKITSIMGFRSKENIILENEMKTVSDKVIIATNDGSFGARGLVTDVLRDIISSGEKINIVVAVGPVAMMKAVSELTRNYNIKTVVSLNALMIDASGMCGGCRVTVGGEVKFSCVDGPDFDGHRVDFDMLTSRLAAYKAEEKQCIDHHCLIEKRIKEAQK